MLLIYGVKSGMKDSLFIKSFSLKKLERAS